MNSSSLTHRRPLAVLTSSSLPLRRYQASRILSSRPVTRRISGWRHCSHASPDLGGTEAAALEAELAALDASIGAVQADLQLAEANTTKEGRLQTAYETEIANLTAEIKARKQQLQDQSTTTQEEDEDVKHMLARVDQLKEDAASLSLTLTERREEIAGLKRQLAEFDESVEPVRAYAAAGLREVGGEAGGLATMDRPNWGNDWGKIKMPGDLAKLSGRPVPEVPSAVALPMQLPAAAKRDITREAGVPGLLLAAGGMAIGRIWKTIKSAFPPEGGPWFDLGALSLIIGAITYTSNSQ